MNVALHATIRKHIHLVHMETSDDVVCIDRTLADTDYSYFIDIKTVKRTVVHVTNTLLVYLFFICLSNCVYHLSTDPLMCLSIHPYNHSSIYLSIYLHYFQIDQYFIVVHTTQYY